MSSPPGDLQSSDATASSANPGSPIEQARINKLQKQRPVPLKDSATGSDKANRPSNIAVSSSPMPIPNRLGSVSPSQIIDPVYRRTSSPFSGSPGRHHFQSASPRHLSPATSQIFERDVQESTLAPELSPAIPSHVQIEDHIPPVLEASSLAITDEKLDPDEVAIVTHTAHMPAALTVTGSNLSDSGMLSPVQSLAPHSEAAGSSIFPGHEQHSHHAPNDETGSQFGAGVEPGDPRRLSFISFADVVHAEQADAGVIPGTGGQQSPSPVRSPVSSLDRVPLSPSSLGLGDKGSLSGSPPNASTAIENPASAKNAPGVLGTGSGGPGSISSAAGYGGGGVYNELNIESMRQTLESVAAASSNTDLTASSSMFSNREPLGATTASASELARSFK